MFEMRVPRTMRNARRPVAGSFELRARDQGRFAHCFSKNIMDEL